MVAHLTVRYVYGWRFDVAPFPPGEYPEEGYVLMPIVDGHPGYGFLLYAAGSSTLVASEHGGGNIPHPVVDVSTLCASPKCISALGKALGRIPEAKWPKNHPSWIFHSTLE